MKVLYILKYFTYDHLMIKRIVAIAFIFGCTSMAWVLLGGTIAARTHSTGERLRGLMPWIQKKNIKGAQAAY